ncbi:cupredoxin domain-containing protein [Lacimicrobium alkaliphilum]|uniref:EfeO-type cupredoxin-like domain-containing protein n=1 Tax=Lacimicrobium alkaliphilum TaxID=1526571 RepID=A0ABQ1RFA0_9ALTE|nr:cupredoxin domain-containing protein [Lacimicrobium alkaliphilum]GGD68609.1 hypothetical protein GCM10011357_24600 [Lacimicrobium alkaliphilum]
MLRYYKRLLLLTVIALNVTFSARAELPEFHLTLNHNLFYPQRLEVPAGEKIRLIIDNQDDAPEEFDSFDLNREKVLFPGRFTVIYIGPLEPGVYHFFGEFHPNQAKGQIRAISKGHGGAD